MNALDNALDQLIQTARAIKAEKEANPDLHALLYVIRSQVNWTLEAEPELRKVAGAILFAGYRTPVVIGYAVVGGRSGQFVRSFGADEREAAQAFAEESTRDCADIGIDFAYRVAEIVDAAS